MKNKIISYYTLLLLFTLISCESTPKQGVAAEGKIESGLSITVEPFGTTFDGPANLYTLENRNGMMIKVTNYGGIITELHVPDKNGKLADITLGFDSLALYQEEHPYFGSLIGRYGNRIAKGKFSIDGEKYTIPTNNGPNTLHGGDMGFNRRLWKATTIETNDNVGIILTRRSTDMEEGYPGNLDVKVTYLLNNNNEWKIEYEATTDKKTPVNLTQHAYFNLNGAGDGDILSHELMIKASRYTPVDETLIPTGELATVEGTPFDFRSPTPIGARVNEENQQLEYGLGYDHNWVIDRTTDEMEVVASLYEPNSGRLMEIITIEPGLQFYCGNFLDGSNIGKKGKAYQYRTGLCLETQHFPDSPNQEVFPSTILEPGQVYKTKTIYRFSTK
ncbi:MAG: aldose epimerase family protein [Bacteroidota bacterium]